MERNSITHGHLQSGESIRFTVPITDDDGKPLPVEVAAGGLIIAGHGLTWETILATAEHLERIASLGGHDNFEGSAAFRR